VPNRILIVLTVLVWYVTVRYAVYHYFIPRVMSQDGELDEFDWWFSWAWSIPITALSIVIPGALIAFVLYGF
jgi:hypothetical protein